MDQVLLPVRPAIDRFLYRAVFRLRWIVLAALLLITVLQPVDSRLGSPTWTLVLLFAVYNLLVDLLRTKLPWLRSFAHLAVLDLAMATLIYGLGTEPGGLMFVVFFLAVDSATVGFDLRGTAVYIAVVAAIVLVIDVTAPGWSLSGEDVRLLGGQLIILGLAGGGMALLTRRLVLEHEYALTVRDEAARLDTLDQLRSEFLATVSHDLRTPLTAAHTALELVAISAADRLRSDEQALMDNGRRNIHRLNQLIGDLLVFNQLEAGALRLEREVMDLRTVIHDAISSVYPLIVEKGQVVDIDLPEPLKVNADRRRLEQVVVNLLVNAHTHTPMQSHVTIRGWKEGTAVRVAVGDNGPGIHPDEQQAIFQRFYRSTQSTSAGEDGSGLGLAIAKGIVELHGGHIWVESDPGTGATFYLDVLGHEDADEDVS